MQTEVKDMRCPEFGFAFMAKCINSNCLFFNESHQTGSFHCLKLDSEVKTGLDYVTMKNSKLLQKLAKSDDPVVQLEASRMLLHFSFILSFKVQKFEKTDFLLCKCGSRLDSCHGGPVCERRQQWFGWLMKMFSPVVALNSSLTQREVFHIIIHSILFYRKTMKFPALIEEAIPGLIISKRML